MSELLWLAILSPLAIGLALLVFRGVGRTVRGVAAVFGVVIPLVVLAALWSLTGGMGRMFAVGSLLLLDSVGLLLATVFAFVWFLATVYSVFYLDRRDHQDDYYAFLLIMLGAVIGVCFSRSMIALYTSWELAGIATWRLVAYFRRDSEIAIAGRTFLITFAGSVTMMVGMAMVYFNSGSMDVSRLAGVEIGSVPALLMLAGIVTKSASFPLYVWLPEAHTAAPSPVSALLSGVVAKIGLVAYIRLFSQSGVVLPAWWGSLVAGIGVIGALVAGGCALREPDIKRVLAFSTVSQLGYIFIAFGLADGSAIAAGVIYLLAHALAKSGLFLALGQVERLTGRRAIADLGGLARTMPVTAAAVALLMLSVIGIPPLIGFFAKFRVLLVAVPSSTWVAAGAVLAAVLTLLYMLRLYRVFTGAPSGAESIRERAVMTACVVVLAFVSTGIGVIYPWLAGLLENSLRF
jgi:formate hydrogenlyase subunit 3/multisubunit Na+/H+ antiporter MnhD subunit